MSELVDCVQLSLLTREEIVAVTAKISFSNISTSFHYYIALTVLTDSVPLWKAGLYKAFTDLSTATLLYLVFAHVFRTS